MQALDQGRKRGHGLPLGLGLVAYGMLLGCIVFWPRPVDRGMRGHLDQLLGQLHSSGVPEWVDYELVESLANVALFLPAGLLLAAWLSPRFSWLAAVAGLCVSVGIEVAQALLLPERYATPHDVMANGLGAALGTVGVYAWRSRGTKIRPGSPVSPE